MSKEFALKYFTEKNKGNIYFLGYQEDDKQVNFVANPSDLKVTDKEDGLSVPGYSSICIGYKSDSYNKSSQLIPFTADSSNENQFVYTDSVISVRKSFINENNKLQIILSIKNMLSTPLEIDELSVSVPVNNDFSPFRYDQDYLYRSRVHEHIYPGGTSGYQMVQKLNGEPPFLYVIPQGDTRFEYTSHYPGSTLKNRNYFSWPGSSLIFLHAKGYLERNNYKPLMGKDSVSSRVLAAGEAAVYFFEAGFVQTLEQFKALLLDSGKMSAAAVPCMVCAIDNEVNLHIDTKYDLITDRFDEAEVLDIKRKKNGYILKLKFDKTGEHCLTLRNAHGDTMYVVFYIIAPLKELLQKRSEFIFKNQLFNDPDHKLNGAFLPYSEKEVPGLFPKGLYINETSLWGDGGYEGGITEAIFLAYKNILLPDASQVEALETYVDTYVRRYLQNTETNEVIFWCGALFTFRSYEYTHVANFYYGMYLIAKNYNLTAKHSKIQYLTFAYQTLMAMYKYARRMDMIVGVMGGTNYFAILKSMQEEDMIAESYELLANIQQHHSNMFNYNLPYGSECSYDNTGLECVMSFADYFNDAEWVDKLSKIITAVRGIQPVWWWNGSDIRWWDADVDFSECTHHYTSPFNSGAMINALCKNQINIDPDFMSSVYGGLFGAFSKIRDDGFASMSYCWEPESDNYGFHTFTGDSGFSFFGALLFLGSFVRGDKDDMIGYLCSISKTADGYFIRPTDGFGRRISWNIEKADGSRACGRIEITTGSIASIKTNADFSRFDLTLELDPISNYETALSFYCPIDYESELFINDKKVYFNKVSDNYMEIKVKSEEGTACRVTFIL